MPTKVAHTLRWNSHTEMCCTSKVFYQLELLVAQVVEQSIMASSLLLLAQKPPMT